MRAGIELKNEEDQSASKELQDLDELSGLDFSSAADNSNFEKIRVVQVDSCLLRLPHDVDETLMRRESSRSNELEIDCEVQLTSDVFGRLDTDA